MSENFDRLVSVMTRLRGEKGCPWDREQNHDSLKPYLLEEVYEVLEALEDKDSAALKEELGDLLFQVLFHSQIAKENKAFDIEAVLVAITEKMIHRHPHVFSKTSAGTSEADKLDAKTVLSRWEEIKKKESRNQDRKSVLDGIPVTLPALSRAQQLQSRAARVGFDWPDASPVRLKIEEELKELEEAISEGNQAEVENELGDVLFTLVNYARFLRVNSEDALRGAIQRFSRRFQSMESEIEKAGCGFDALSFDEMNALWEKAKSNTAL